MTAQRGVKASAVAAFLNKPLQAGDVDIHRMASWSGAGPASVVFIQRLDPDAVGRFNQIGKILVLCDAASAERLTCPHIVVDDPRLAFALVAQAFFEAREERSVAATAVVHSGARIGGHVSIGHGAVIEDHVEIGPDSSIGHGVVIRSRTRIGARCVIRAKAVIGEPGFGFDFDGNIPVRLPHFGGVRIGDDVQVGCGSTVSCGTLDDTIIGDRVKIDDQVVVAHNAVIGEGSIITAGAIICGSVRIGRSAWIGAGSIIRQGGVEVGDGAMVGLGAVVMTPVLPRQVVMGNPARLLRMRGEKEEF